MVAAQTLGHVDTFCHGNEIYKSRDENAQRAPRESHPDLSRPCDEKQPDGCQFTGWRLRSLLKFVAKGVAG